MVPRLALALGVLAVGCTISPLSRLDGSGGSGGNPGDGGTTNPDGGCGAVSYQADIHPWFQLRCGGCHDWNAIQLVTLAPRGDKCGPLGAGANFSSSWRLVAPGDLGNSVLWWFAQDCCAPACGASCAGTCLSPPCSSALAKCRSDDPLCQTQHRTTDAERARLQCWILAGAPAN